LCCVFLVGGPRGADRAAEKLDFRFDSGGVAVELFFERDFQVALFYFGYGDFVGFAGLGEGLAEEFAFGGAQQGMGGEDFFEWRESSACGRQDGTACDLIFLVAQGVDDFTKAG
jgi:hypothetical protein